MKQYSDLEYLKLSRGKRLLYRLTSFFLSIPKGLWQLLLKLWSTVKKFGLFLGREVTDVISTFKNGDRDTRLSYLIMGWGSLRRGQWLRGGDVPADGAGVYWIYDLFRRLLDRYAAHAGREGTGRGEGGG